ncbi:MAG TPA: hypothetical protein VMB03_22540 [Bryobacteraceae bacterium]|nr:hypothetical protein [Bryobacteraceae bacterium]
MAEVPQELLAKLPRTFVPALNEQMRDLDSLFPAEQRSLTAQIDWLARLPDAQFRELFEPLKALEAKMELPAWDVKTEHLTIRDTGILVRSPYYPQWRSQVAEIFQKVDAGVSAEGKTALANRLVVCILPAGLPHRSEPMWPRLEKQGRWIGIEKPFAEMLEPFAAAVASRRPAAGLEPVERTWALEYGAKLSGTQAFAPARVLSFDALGPLRREFLLRLNTIHKDLRSADAVLEELRRMDFRKFLPDRVEQEARTREFIRNLFLSGNGSMLFGNSFVQWGAAEVVRRAQPQALFCAFGIRPKLKPFSSVVLFEDQNRANPVADEADPEGSLGDVRLLTEYVYLSANQHPAFAGRTVYLFAVPEWNSVLLLAPAKFSLASEHRLAVSDLCSGLTNWLA